MAGRFDPIEASKLIAACHRRCCVCHRFCGSKMELDHIVPGADQGPDTIDNAIPVCFDCHAEIHAYNDRHPRGRKFRAEELMLHKDQWLEICRSKPSVFDGAAGRAPAGPLEAMVDEIDFNVTVASNVSRDELGCLLLDDQFRRAIAAGSIAILEESVKKDVLAAYAAVGLVNQCLAAVVRFEHGVNAWAEAFNRAQTRMRQAQEPLRKARQSLQAFLGFSPVADEIDQATRPSAVEPVVGFEERSRGWANVIRTALLSGQGNTVDVNESDMPFAEWAVKQGLLEWFIVGSVKLPGL